MCVCTREGHLCLGCGCPGRCYLHGEVKQGSAPAYPSRVGVQWAPWHAGWVLGASTQVLVSTGPALTHGLMDAGWHGTARHGTVGTWPQATMGAGWSWGDRGTPRRWVTLWGHPLPTGNRIRHGVGIREAAHGTPHPWFWAPWGAWGTPWVLSSHMIWGWVAG